MHDLAQQRCFNHAAREASARCPECRRFFCRECVTEHDDRVLCATCLKTLAKARFGKHPAFVTFVRAAQFMAGLVIAWFFFFLVGLSLASMPDSFHEGSLWHVPWIEQP